jgi:hypothetical protein
VRVRLGAATASEGRFFGMTTELVDCFDARGLDSAAVVVVVVLGTLTVDGFRLRGRFAAGFSISFFPAFVISPSAGFLCAFVTSPKAARFRVPTVVLLPSFEGRAVVVVVISVVVASLDRVILVCCTLFSSCRVF